MAVHHKYIFFSFGLGQMSDVIFGSKCHLQKKQKQKQKPELWVNWFDTILLAGAGKVQITEYQVEQWPFFCF